MSKMLFVKSNDYWGYDASQFDDTVNFYRFTWVVPEAMYKTLDSDDQSSLNPCALFYVQGVTDNHNFLTLKIAQDGDEAKVSGMQGTKRRTRRYNIGSPAQYSVGSYALQEAPAGATSVEAIKEAVESGSTSEGSFNVSEFLTEAADIAAAVNMVTEEKSAETFAAPAEVPSGSAYEPADPTVANPATEGYSESDLITMDEFSAMEYTPEIGGYPGLPVIPDSYGENSAGEGFGVPVWYGSAETEDDENYYESASYISGEIDSKVDELLNMISDGSMGSKEYIEELKKLEVLFDQLSDKNPVLANNQREEWMESYSEALFGSAEEDEDYDAEEDEYLCKYCGQDPDASFAADFWTDGVCLPCAKEHGEYEDYDAEGGRLRDIRGKFMNRRKAKDAVFGEVMSQQMSGYYRTGIVGDNPPVGQNIARRNPVAKARYFIEPGVQNPNSGEWSKGPNFQQARKIAKGVAWDTVQDMGLAAEAFESEGLDMTTLGDQEFPVIPDSYGESSAVVSGRGVPQWYGSAEGEGDAPEEDYVIIQTPKSEIDFGRLDGVSVHPGREILRAIAPREGAYFDFYADEWEDARWANLPDMTDEEYDACYFDFKKGGVFDGSDNMIVSMDDFADAIANYEITNIDGNYVWTEDSKLPERHTTSRRKITETLEEAAPVSLKKPVFVAAISALTGFLIARRKA